jgi:hypothetical protein
MSVVVKTIGGRQYAYLARRMGDRVAHKYLGPLLDPRVAERVSALRAEGRIPSRFHPLFWDADPGRVDLRRNSRYVIERVLEIGDLDAIRWTQLIYPTRLIMEVCRASRKVPPKSRNFWEIWFNAS